TKPLPLVMNGNRQMVPVDYFINNDLKCLQGGISNSLARTASSSDSLTIFWITGGKVRYFLWQNMSSRLSFKRINCFKFSNFFFQCYDSVVELNTNAKLGSADGGFIASVVGGGVGVDYGGGGVKDGIDCGMTVEYIGDDSVITKTGTVRSVGVCLLGTS
nr:hypothetical protein [Tanacetum cinerariifolium]